MKKVMLVVLAGMFSVVMVAQAQTGTKPVEKKKEHPKSEVAKPATTKETAKPAATHESGKSAATKETTKPVAKPK